MPRRVLYILSSNYSGSHYLSLLLGSHSKLAHVGEIRHRRRPGRPHRNRCHLCDPPESCPLVRGITPEAIDQVYDVLWSNLGDPDLTLVDASKRILWAERFAQREDLDRRYIHLLSDPRALARRWAVTFTTRKQRLHVRWSTIKRWGPRGLPLLLASQSRIHGAKWLAQNLRITSFCERHAIEPLLVTYRDLARDTETELRRIMDWLGEDYDPRQLEYWTHDHHGSQKPDYEWIKKQRTTGHIDLRWQDFFDDPTRNRIVGHSSIRRYLARLGLHAVNDGLTRHGYTEPGQNSPSARPSSRLLRP